MIIIPFTFVKFSRQESNSPKSAIFRRIFLYLTVKFGFYLEIFYFYDIINDTIKEGQNAVLKTTVYNSFDFLCR